MDLRDASASKNLAKADKLLIQPSQLPSVLYKSTQKGLFKGFVGPLWKYAQNPHCYANLHKRTTQNTCNNNKKSSKKQKQQTTKFSFKEWWVGSDMEKANKSQICLISKKLPNLNCAISSWFWHLCGKSNIQRTAWNLCLGKFVRKYEICGREKSSWGAIKNNLEGQ